MRPESNESGAGAAEGLHPPTRILALDGGGMRGMIPLKILARLEQLAGKPIHELFDIIVGTSTGGIAALCLVAPDADGKPRNTAEGLLDFYVNGGPLIFPRYRERNLLDERVGPAKTHLVQRVAAVFSPQRYGNSRYLPVGLRTMLLDAMADCRLDQALTDVLIPTYDMRHAEPVIFSSAHAAAGEGPNPLTVDIAQATTAAPTYFPPCRLGEGEDDMYLIDGGVVANNPSAIGYFAALQEAHRQERELDVLLVSIGTGHAPHDHLTYEDIWSRGWVRLAAGMLGVVFDASSDMTDQLLRELIARREPNSRYWRFQTELRGVSMYIDDATPLNTSRLGRLGDRMVNTHHDDLVEIVDLLCTAKASQRSAAEMTRRNA